MGNGYIPGNNLYSIASQNPMQTGKIAIQVDRYECIAVSVTQALLHFTEPSKTAIPNWNTKLFLAYVYT